MSKYFDMGDETLWNPSNGAGRLFLKQTEVFEAELETPSGIGPGKHWGDPDTLAVDQAAYAEFVRALVAWHCRTSHTVILALSEGFVATALALARRAGIEVPMPEPVSGDVSGGVRYDIQAPGNPLGTTAAVVEALETRAREMDRWMAR
ncbi:DUF6086 family protein [Streptomyces sp. NPDC092369]|uniref:DUF6086 family protein n=1 Tax=Streptomyces sp. NPDC092369 TaxID=3366015 RepID=UPI0037F13E95